MAITDSLLSPLASIADRTLVIAAAGAGPFDSHVGTLSLCNLLVAGTADRLRAVATAAPRPGRGGVAGAAAR